MPFQIKQITVEELKDKMDQKKSFRLIDVREENECRTARIEGSQLIPLSQFAARSLKELKPEEELVFHCHHGGRSQKACEFLAANGYKNVANVVGGIDAWSEKIDPKVPRY